MENLCCVGINTVKDLFINLNNTESFEIRRQRIQKANFLTWTGLRHPIPSNLKTAQGRFNSDIPCFKYITMSFLRLPNKKSKDFYSIIISEKVQLATNAEKLRQIFNLS